MPVTIDVDTTNERASLMFVDSHGNETPAPAGATITFSSSDASVATISSDPASPQVGAITPVGTPGDTDISVVVDNANEPDGTTPIPNPDPVTLHVDPGKPVGERLSVDATPPVNPDPTPAPDQPEQPAPAPEPTPVEPTPAPDAPVDPSAPVDPTQPQP